MTTTSIAIIREEKVPQDTRTPMTPAQARMIKKQYPSLKILCQSSKIRSYSDDEYRAAGIDVSEDVSNADILLGVKEVKIQKSDSRIKPICSFRIPSKNSPTTSNC
jgi:saccharopine dehydrogenase (NAD+, L-lysine-forming)